MVLWLAVVAQQHPVRATATAVTSSLLLLSCVWSGGGGNELSAYLDVSLRGSTEALPGVATSSREKSRREFNQELEAGSNLSVGVCIDAEPLGLANLPPNRTYTSQNCIEWARNANCRKAPDFMLANCEAECRECQARPRCCIGLHADPDECDESLGVPRWSSTKVDLDERWTLFPDVRSIVEIGGNTGLDASMFAFRFPRARLFSFEPVPEYYKAFREYFHDHPQVTVLNVGLSDRNYSAMFNLDEQSSSDRGMKGRRQVKAELRDVDTVFRELQRDSGGVPDAVSLNCEGCEYPVLRRMAERGWLGRVRFVQMSWHLVLDMDDRLAQRCAIERTLRKHYDPVYFSENFGWQGWRLHGVAGFNITTTTSAMQDNLGSDAREAGGAGDLGGKSVAGQA